MATQRRVAPSEMQWIAVLFLAGALLLGAVAARGEPIALHGVVKAGERPLVGGTVELLPLLGEQAAAELWLSGKTSPEALTRTASDARGAFVVPVREAGNYRIRLTAPGRVPLQIELSGVVESFDLPAAAPALEQMLTVAVRDEAGRPVRDAWVRLVEDRPWLVPWAEISWTSAERRGTTGADGTVRLPRAAGESTTVAVFKAGYLPVEREVSASGRLEMMLESAPRVPTVVVGPDRSPRSGALALVGKAKWPLGPADDAGRLSLPAAGKRSVPLIVRTPGGERRETVLPAAAAPDGAAQRLVLAARRSLTGQVLSGKERAPLAGALVWGFDPGSFVRSDGAGVYRLTELAQDFLLVSAAAAGHRPERALASQLLNDAEVGPTLRLEPAVALVGRVIDGSGSPLADVDLVASPMPLRQNGLTTVVGLVVRGRTALDGSFRLPGVAAEAKVELRAIHRAYAPWREDLPPMPVGPTPPKTIVLDTGRVVWGHVQDVEKRPVAGATVRLFDVAEVGSKLPWDREEPLATGTSDGDGRFTLSHVAAGRYDLGLTARGFAPLRVPGLTIDAADPNRELGTVTLAPGALLEGRVVDASGKAIDGAELYFEPADSSRAFGRSFGDTDEPPTTTSAADGWFRLDDLEPGRPMTITVEHEGFGTTILNRVAVPRAEPLVVVLSPSGGIAGRVATAEGKPIPGAIVGLSVQRAIGESRVTTSVGSPFEPIRTGDDGRFRAEGVEAGDVSVGAGAEGYANALTRLELAPGQVIEDFEIVLLPGARLSGRVLGPDGEPREGVLVMVRQGRSGNAASRSDGEGGFTMDGVPLGRCRVSAWDRELGQVASEVEIVAGENRAELRFASRGEVSGRVLSLAGAPLAGASVELRRVGGVSLGYQRQATGPDGDFRFTALSGGLYELSASADGYAAAGLPEPLRVADAPVSGIDLRLGDGGAVRGRVVGLELSEMTKVRVQARLGDAGISRSTTLDFAGQFRFDHLAVGEWIVAARHGEDGRIAQRTVSVAGDGSEAEVELELPKGIRLSGRVERDGAPVREATIVLAARERQRFLSTSTDLDGRFAFAGLVRGTYDLVVRGRSARLHDEELVLEADREVAIDLTASVTLRGQLVDANDQRPVADATLLLAPAGESPSRRELRQSYAQSDSGGSFRFDGVSPGSYRIRVERDGYETAERPVEVGEGEGEALRFELTSTEGLTLDLRSATGAVPSAVRVALRGADGRLLSADLVNPDERGRVRMGTAPRGSWELLAQSDDSALARVPVVAPGGPFLVLLATGAALDVVVPALAGDDTWVPLRVVDAEGRPFEALSGTQLRGEWRLSRGRARLVGLSPGQWKVSATLPTGGELTASVNAVAGALTTVTLE